MLTRLLRSAVVPLALIVAAPAALASDRDAEFFRSVQGEWSGPGEIVAGKYKGTKFTCRLTGGVPGGKGVGMALDGNCRVGMFTQRMSAVIERNGRGYKGTFLDGAAGKGLDITGGNVNRQGAVMSLIRNELSGAMQAKMQGDDRMHVTVSVHVEKQLVPVIGMNLKRVEGSGIGALARD